MSGDSSINGGWLDGNYMQIVYQLLSIVVVALWSFIFTFIILQVIDLLPFVRLKLTEKEEEMYFFISIIKWYNYTILKFLFLNKSGGDWIELGEVSCKILFLYHFI